jgi:hypothetical protein
VNGGASSILLRDHDTMKIIPFLILACLACSAHATSPTQYVDNMRVHEGDDAAWAAPDFDDSAWIQQSAFRVDPQGRILWMRARVDLPTDVDPAKVPLAVRITMTGSWDLYWNGRLLRRNGVPGSTATSEKPGRIKAEVYIPPELLRKQGNVLALRISTHHLALKLGAPIQRITIGEYRSSIDGALGGGALALLAGGPLLLGALYFAAMFLLDRRDHVSLLLSLLAFAVLGQLLAESVRAFIAYPYPLHIARLVAILCFAALSSVLLVAYVARQWAPHLLRTAVLVTLAAVMAISLSIPGFDGKTTLVLLAGLLIALSVAVAGARRGADGARRTALALAAVIGVLLLNLVRFVDLIYYVSAAALLIFLFVRQAALLRATQLRAAQLEIELLKQKIQPHFLMNTLTALSEWVESSPQTGVRMINALAAEFRAVAAMSHETLVPMHQELELCRHHLTVMGFRGNQTYELHDDGVNPNDLIPPAVFHTLLENVLTHNRHAGGAAFVLNARTEGSRRIYTLRSPMSGEARAKSGSGTGHAYVRARLRAAFGERWRFDSQAMNGEWQDVVEVPCAS